MIILASKSPRRRELLAQLGVNFSYKVSDIDEKALLDETPDELVTRLANAKAQAVYDDLKNKEQAIVIGSDTVVVINGDILGKPTDKQDAFKMLKRLSGKTHKVLTSVALIKHDMHECLVVENNVTFAELTENDINAYWQTGEPIDKAGSYAIQGLAAQFVRHLDGSYSAVMGLPLYEAATLLKKAGIKLLKEKD